MKTAELKKKAKVALANAASEIDAGRWASARGILQDLTGDLSRSVGGQARIKPQLRKAGKTPHNQSQSLFRGLEVLAVVQGQEGLIGVVGVADKLGIPRATAHRYLKTLVVGGYIEHDGVTRKYSAIKEES